MRALCVLFLLFSLLSPLSIFAQDRGNLVQAFSRLKFSKPIDIQFSQATRERFVVEQGGRIFRIFRKDGRFQKRRVLNITRLLSRGGSEQGLLGLALDPNFSENGYIYVNYTNVNGHTQISRFTRNGLRFPVRRELRILTVGQPYRNHNGGALAFGPDGMLYIALGDGGSRDDPHGYGQNRRRLLGKILRIDVSNATNEAPYEIPSDNPFVGNTSNFREEIFAYGLRNPWRMSFDSETGDLWAGDVGQGDWEEVDVIVSGGNYGWSIREGAHNFSGGNCNGCIDPVTEYSHAEGYSITGGYVYRGARHPSLVGAYIFADFVSGTFWTFQNGQRRTLISSSISPSTFGQDWKGEVFVADYSKGKIYRIRLRRNA